MSGSIDTDTVLPDPPRFRWLKRCLLGAIVVLACLFGVRPYWGHVVHKRLAATVPVSVQRADARREVQHSLDAPAICVPPHTVDDPMKQHRGIRVEWLEQHALAEL